MNKKAKKRRGFIKKKYEKDKEGKGTEGKKDKKQKKNYVKKG
jgi:hypothetical protein